MLCGIGQRENEMENMEGENGNVSGRKNKVNKKKTILKEIRNENFLELKKIVLRFLKNTQS